MDGFTGFKTAAAEEIRRGRGDGPSMWCAWPATPSTTAAAAFGRPPAAVRTTRSTVPGEPPVPTCSPTSRPPDSTALFAIDEHVEVEATWGIYQRMIAAYRHR